MRVVVALVVVVVLVRPKAVCIGRSMGGMYEAPAVVPSVRMLVSSVVGGGAAAAGGLWVGVVTGVDRATVVMVTGAAISAAGGGEG